VNEDPFSPPVRFLIVRFAAARKEKIVVRTVNLNADIPPDRELRITLPADVPVGPAEIVLVVSTSDRSSGQTLGDFEHSEFFGMWRDRSDIVDSVQFARGLRSDGWKRPA
jgi:hypothetical protein